MTGEILTGCEAWEALQEKRMVEPVFHVDLGPIEESNRPRFKLINGRIKRYGNFDEDWIDIEIRVDIWMKCRFRVVK